MTLQNILDIEHSRAKLTIRDFFLLEESGALKGYYKTELLGGDIYYMNAQYRRHSMTKIDLHNSLHSALTKINSTYRSVTEVTVALTEHDAPEPDIVLTNQPYGDGPIPVISVALVIEVSDTTLKTDLEFKAPLYAKAAIPEYWVVDIEGKCVVQMSAPSAEGYAVIKCHVFGAQIKSAMIDGLTVSTDVLG
jgi:Uma2 family endonuclease